MLCQNCNAELHNDAKFCPKCGEAVGASLNTDSARITSENLADVARESTPTKLKGRLAVLAHGYFAMSILYLLLVLLTSIVAVFLIASMGITFQNPFKDIVALLACAFYIRFSFGAYFCLKRRESKFLRYYETAAFFQIFNLIFGDYEVGGLVILVFCSIVSLLLAFVYFPLSAQVRDWMDNTEFIQKSLLKKISSSALLKINLQGILPKTVIYEIVGISMCFASLLYIINLLSGGIKFTFWGFLSYLVAPGILAYLALSKWKEYKYLFFVPVGIKGLVGFIGLFSNTQYAPRLLANLLAVTIAILFILTILGKIKGSLLLLASISIAIITSGQGYSVSNVIFILMPMLFYVSTALVAVDENTAIQTTGSSFFFDAIKKVPKKLIISIGSVALVIIMIVAVSGNVNSVQGTYRAYKNYGVVNYDPYIWVKFDGKEIIFNEQFYQMKGKYEIKGNTLIVDVNGYDEFNYASAFVTGHGSPYSGKLLVDGEITYSFRKEGKTIWIDGKEYQKR